MTNNFLKIITLQYLGPSLDPDLGSRSNTGPGPGPGPGPGSTKSGQTGPGLDCGQSSVNLIRTSDSDEEPSWDPLPSTKNF